jgi:glycosyltransferase involved in cell wall biosynthesis
MRVSIITVCFNSAATIRDAIESVLSQSYDDIEYIVVDGASTDGTLEILGEYRAQIHRIISEPDNGIYDAMNKGVSLSTGDIVGILNSDDFFESHDSIQYVVDSFGKDGELDIVFGDVVFVSPDDVTTIRRFYSSRKFKPWKLRFGWMPPHPATFVRRRAYQKCGKYSLKYKIAADYEMLIRWLVVHEVTYSRIDRVLVRMRQGGVSTAGISSNFRLNREIVEACVSNGIYTNFALLLLKIPFKLLELARKPRTGIR